MNSDKPTWERGDKLRSVYGVFASARVALAQLLTNISEFPSRIDTKEADRLNGEDDD